MMVHGTFVRQFLMRSFFVIDVGNTSTKWGIANSKRILREYEFPTAKFTEGRWNRYPRLNLPKNLSGAIISCVVPKALPAIKAYLTHLGISKLLVVSAKMDLGIGVRYPEPKKIGADRLVNTVAAIALYGAPAIVVDFGTAVTFDVISKKKEYLGGVIAPGLNAMTHYLHERTALLPAISLAEPMSAIGKSTVAAMRVGAVVGYRGLVHEILLAICREMKVLPHKRNDSNRKETVEIIATGGHSPLIASKISEIRHINPQLTLHGLRILYNRYAQLALK